MIDMPDVKTWYNQCELPLDGKTTTFEYGFYSGYLFLLLDME